MRMRKKITVIGIALLVVALFAACNGEAGSGAKLVTVGLNLADKSQEDASKEITASVPAPTDLSQVASYKILVTDLSDNANRYVDLKVSNSSVTGANKTTSTVDGHSVTTFTVTKAAFTAANASPQFVLSQGTWKFEVIAYDNATPANEKQIGYGKIDSQVISNSTAALNIYLAQDFGNTSATLTVKIGGATPSSSSKITTAASATETSKQFAVIVKDSAGTVKSSATGSLTSDTTTANTHSTYGTLTYTLTPGWHTVSLVYQQSANGTSWTTLKEYTRYVNVLESCTVQYSGTLIEGQFSNDTIGITSHYVTLGAIDITEAGGVSLASVALDGNTDYTATSTNYVWTFNSIDAGSGTTATTATFTQTSPAVAAGDYVINCKVTITVDGVSYSASVAKPVRWVNGKLTAR